jgi:hypothetical protein
MEQRGSDTVYRTNKAFADKFRERTAEAASEFAKNRDANVHFTYSQKVDIEKQVAYDLSRENKTWVDNIYTLGKHFASGNENTVVLNEKEQVVYKSNNLMNTFGSIETLLRTIEAHNNIFPETAYETVGFTGLENKGRAPYVEVILKQPFIKQVEHATPQEIADFMKYRGFKQINSSTFENPDYVVSDLHPRNVLKNADGTIFVIDNRIETKALSERLDMSFHATPPPENKSRAGNSTSTEDF